MAQNQDIAKIRTALTAISSHLNNVSTALSCLETAHNTAVSQQVAPLGERVKAMLNGEYKLRTMQSLIDATGASRTEILRALECIGAPITLKRRRNDRAELVGLVCRNQ